jgi:hypothetical protein
MEDFSSAFQRPHVQMRDRGDYLLHGNQAVRTVKQDRHGRSDNRRDFRFDSRGDSLDRRPHTFPDSGRMLMRHSG